MIPLRNSSPATPGFLHRGITRCLLGLGSLAAFSSLPARAQYAEWTATPPKILPNERPGAGTSWQAGSGRQFPNPFAFAALTADRSIRSWGATNIGGSGAPTDLGYKAIYSNQGGFAALKADGSIKAWGWPPLTQTPTDSGYVAIHSTVDAFAALRSDGAIRAWGSASNGGSGAPTDVGYTAIYSNWGAFAALKADGSITAWGASYNGGTGAPTDNGYVRIYSNRYVFVAMKADGSIRAWGGDANNGGTGAPTDSGYRSICSNEGAFAALDENGAIHVWGDANHGGSHTGLSTLVPPTGTGYTGIFATNAAFAAIKNGFVFAWGATWDGGSLAPTGGGYVDIQSNAHAFVARKEDGSLYSWGAGGSGGLVLTEGTNGSEWITSAPAGTGHHTICSNQLAFAALNHDGTISEWGAAEYGGSGAPEDSGYIAIYSSAMAFAALKEDGSIRTWGRTDGGGAGAPTDTGFRFIQSINYRLNESVVVTAASGSVSSSSASVTGAVEVSGTAEITERGWVYAPTATTADPMIDGAGVTRVAASGSGDGSYSAVLGDLSPNTAYALKGYVIDAGVAIYSDAVQFSTNLPPLIITEGAAASASVTVAENSSAVTTVSATDADAGQAISYSITGGTDAARFDIGSTSGVLTFATAPDYEAPADADADNVYEVVVSATDNGNTPKSATQTLSVTVTNEVDNGALVLEQANGSTVASGGSVDFGSLTLGQTADLTFTLRSVGEADLDLPDGMALGGSSPSAFSLVGIIPESLATGSSVTFTVRFSPFTGGSHTAALSVATNDTRAGKSPHVLNLTGTGLTASTLASYSNAANQVRGGWINGTDFTIGAVTTNWPSAESPEKAVDNNTGSKFLALRNNNVGLILSPTNATVAFNRLSLSTANDFSDRDPASYVIYGSPTVLTGTSGTNLPLAALTQLASGMIVLPDNRSTGPTVVQFANTTPYASYIVAFPTVRSTSSNTMTQISEVQLSQGMNPSYPVAMTDARGGQLSGSTFTFGSIGNSNPGTNWKAEESPDQALDGSVATKYLLFRNTGAGLIASPQAGPARVNRLSFWTANDFAERDPLTYEVYGLSTAVTARSGTLDVGTGGTLLGSGTLALSATRVAGPETVSFDNSTAYASYLVVFPTVKNSPSTTMAQIGEVQFGYNGVPDFTLPTGVTTPVGEIWTARESNREWVSIASSADGTKLAAVAYNGQIHTSTDSGVTWTARESEREWQSIASSSDGTRLAAVVYDGQIYTSTDSGVSWTARESSREWVSIASSADGTKLAAVDFGGQIYTSINSGESWTARGDNRYWTSISSSADGAKLAAVADGSRIYTSTDSGVNWTPRESPERWWLSITSSADGTKLAAVIYGGQIYTSSDSGANWTARENQRDWMSIASSTDGTRLAAAAEYGRIYISSDSGVNWTARESDRDWVTICSSADGSKLAAVVQVGQIYTSSAFTAPYIVSVAEDSGSYSEAAFATGITPGLGDLGQTVSLASTNDNNALFSAQPVIAADGTLTFTPASNASGTATVTVIATDSTGLTSVPQSFVIEVTPSLVPSAPTALVATAGDGEVSIAFTAGADGGSAITNYEYSADDGNSWTPFDPVLTASPAVITGLTNGTAYSIRLRAVNAAGNGTSSDAVSSTPVDPPIVFRAASKAAAMTSISVSKMTSKAGSVLGTTVSVASVAATSEQGATVALSGSSIQYSPALGFSGVDRFRVTFSSSEGSIVGLVEMTTAVPGYLANPARLTPLSGGRMGIQFNGIPGVAYQLQRSTDLNTWTTIATITAGSRGEIDFTDDNPPVSNGFYRLFKP